MQQWAGVHGVLVVPLIEAEHERLNHQVSESVGSCGEHIADAGVYVFIIPRVVRQVPGNELWTDNV